MPAVCTCVFEDVCALLAALQDILTLSEPLCGNLHELSDSVKRLANKALSSGPAAAEGITAELAGAAGAQHPFSLQHFLGFSQTLYP